MLRKESRAFFRCMREVVSGEHEVRRNLKCSSHNLRIRLCDVSTSSTKLEGNQPTVLGSGWNGSPCEAGCGCPPAAGGISVRCMLNSRSPSNQPGKNTLSLHSKSLYIYVRIRKRHQFGQRCPHRTPPEGPLLVTRGFYSWLFATTKGTIMILNGEV